MTDETRTTAALFDIDGTLVDSNYQHIEAWDHAFTETGNPVLAWRVHRLIGADAGKLTGDLAPDASPDTIARIKDLHAERYRTLAHRLQVIPGTRELVRDLAERGVKVVLATSAPQQELEILLPLLDIDRFVSVTTSGEDVETAKPEPGIVLRALEQAGIAAENAIMIGDATWDVRAAREAGVDTIGVRSGGISAAELTEAGAVGVYDDVAALRQDMENSPLARLWQDRS